MYNTELTCTYMEKESNELYQQELLQVFHLTSYENLGRSIEKLYHIMKENTKLQELIKEIQEKYPWTNKDHCVYFLFSYDYLHSTHEHIKDILIHDSQLLKNMTI